LPGNEQLTDVIRELGTSVADHGRKADENEARVLSVDRHRFRFVEATSLSVEDMAKE
jgi:hypothetical protein